MMPVAEVELPVLAMAMRYIHMLSASLAIGVPIFVRFVLTPAAQKVLEPEAHLKLRAAVNAVWRKFVYAMITLFLISGAYTLMAVSMPQIRGSSDRVMYDALFGFKVILALVVFFIASALPGQTKALEPLRRNAKMWLVVLVVLVLTILMMSVTLRSLREAMSHPAVTAGAITR